MTVGMIKDFNCTYDNFTGISEDIVHGLDLKFPDAYTQGEPMARLTQAIKRHLGAAFCCLPYCHTTEGDAMGARVVYGDATTGPRVREFVYNSLEEVLALPDIDFSKGRIHETLLACRRLHDAGEHVALNISGPITILATLVDITVVVKTAHKNRPLMQKVYDKMGENIFRYMEQAKACGVGLLAYADPTGGVNILGPKLSLHAVEDFTAGFVKKMATLADSKTMIVLCPKTTFALQGTGRAGIREAPLPEPEMRYGEACLAMLGKVRLAGQMCIKNIDYHIRNGVFRELVLNEEQSPLPSFSGSVAAV